MKKRFATPLVLLALLLGAIPAQAALRIDAMVTENEYNRVVSMITANAPETERSEAEESQVMQAVVDANMLINTRFPMAQYMIAMNRVGGREDGIFQTLRLWQDETTASIAVLWQGEQADGTRGSSVQTLAIDLNTGAEVVFDALFDEPEAAAAMMEAIIEREIVDGLSDYMEYGDLLPMPRDSFSYDENGLTVYYPQERYLYFSGRSGAVHFAWHELRDFIAEGSPIYDLSRSADAGSEAIARLAASGKLPGAMQFGLGDRLGDALDALTLLADPDYTTDSLVYQFEDEALRGFALEIPKYAESDEEETPISAVRAARIDLYGLETGKTTREEASVILGEPQSVQRYDRDDAADRMLPSGESAFYSIEGRILQLHYDESGVLAVIILRSEMPQVWL